MVTNDPPESTLLQELTENYISHVGLCRRAKQSGVMENKFDICDGHID